MARRRGRRGDWTRRAAALALCVVAAGCSPTQREGREPAPSPSRIVLLGDSLAEEVAPVLGLVRPALAQTRLYYGGTAPCDWLDDDIAADPSAVVVVQFTGNSLTPCMEDAAGAHLAGQAIVDAYRRDVTTIVSRARKTGAWVVLVGQPHRAASFGAEAVVDGLNAVYRSLASSEPYVAFIDAGAVVQTPDGRYTDRLPCESFDERCEPDGTTIVRGDGVHFCPIADQSPCTVWSGGAFRFARAIAIAVDAPALFD